MQFSKTTLLLALLLAAFFVAQPDAAYAGFGRMFCGWAGIFGNSPLLKIVGTVIVVLLCAKALSGTVSWMFTCITCGPIVILALGPALLYGLTGEDCTIPEDVPSGSSMPVMQGGSQPADSGMDIQPLGPHGSAIPLPMMQHEPNPNEPEQAPDSELNIQEAAPHGSSIPLPTLQRQLDEQGQPNPDQDAAPPPPDTLTIPEAAPHGSSMPLPMIPPDTQ